MKVEQKFSSSQTPRLNSPQTQKPWVQEGMKQYVWILDYLAPTMVVFKIKIALLMEYWWEIHCKWIIDRIVSVLKQINLAEISPPDAAPSLRPSAVPWPFCFRVSAWEHLGAVAVVEICHGQYPDRCCLFSGSCLTPKDKQRCGFVVLLLLLYMLYAVCCY